MIRRCGFPRGRARWWLPADRSGGRSARWRQRWSGRGRASWCGRASWSGCAGAGCRGSGGQTLAVATSIVTILHPLHFRIVFAPGIACARVVTPVVPPLPIDRVQVHKPVIHHFTTGGGSDPLVLTAGVAVAPPATVKATTTEAVGGDHHSADSAGAARHRIRRADAAPACAAAEHAHVPPRPDAIVEALADAVPVLTTAVALD